MKLAHAHYHLRFKQGGMREGALLRITFDDGLIGYADCHPWEIRGDLPLQKQLACWQKGQLTPLMRNSLQFARLDAEARSKRVNLLQNVNVPKSHYLFISLDHIKPQSVAEAVSSGFSIFKIKIKASEELHVLLERIAPLLQTGGKIRFDFNNCLSPETYEQFLNMIDPHKEQIDFCEDPFPYDQQIWQAKQRGIPFARDVAETLEDNGAPILIFKPAIQQLPNKIKSRIICTSYLDHPIGQLFATYTAAKLYQSYPLEVCGLASHLVYEENAFSAQLGSQPTIMPVDGSGIGFDTLLQQQHWTQL